MKFVKCLIKIKKIKYEYVNILAHSEQEALEQARKPHNVIDAELIVINKFDLTNIFVLFMLKIKDLFRR